MPAGTSQRDSHSRVWSLALTAAYATAHEQRTAHPCRPARGRCRPRQPPLPRLRRAAVRLALAQPGLGGPVSRCESCGLGVVGGSGGPEEALRELGAAGAEATPRIANRASFAASLGNAGWAGLEPGAHYLFSAEAVRRLVARRDQVVKSNRWAPLASLAATWQTLLNSVTFGHNVALAALGRAEPVPAKHAWQRRIDALASVVLAIPALLIAIPVELAGGLLGRGAVISLRFELL